MRGAGSGIDNTSDQFHFVYRQVSGDLDVIARVASIEAVSPTSQAGVMLRATLTGPSPNAFMRISASSGAAFQRRNTSGARTILTDIAVSPPRWVKITRRGTLVMGFVSSDGRTWTGVGADNPTLPATVYVGIAVSSRTTARTATAAFDSVSVVGAGAPVNQGPSVSLTAPAQGSRYTPPATIALSATAADADGTISKVDFYANSTLVGTDTSSPYSFSWRNVAAGSYSLTARATDNAGATTTSAAVSITVATSTPTNQPPTVSLTAPSAGASYAPPASITIAASAADSDGTVTRVDFYQGSTLLGSDTSSPYSFAWTNVPAGSYSIVAIARDNAGASTTSGSRTVTVSSSSPTRATFTASANHDTAVTQYVLDIFTSSANPATATPVATRGLGKPAVVSGGCDVDVSSTIASLPAGTYIATVTAVGPGGSARSTASPAFSR